MQYNHYNAQIRVKTNLLSAIFYIFYLGLYNVVALTYNSGHGDYDIEVSITLLSDNNYFFEVETVNTVLFRFIWGAIPPRVLGVPLKYNIGA